MGDDVRYMGKLINQDYEVIDNKTGKHLVEQDIVEQLNIQDDEIKLLKESYCNVLCRYDEWLSAISDTMNKYYCKCFDGSLNNVTDAELIRMICDEWTLELKEKDLDE